MKGRSLFLLASLPALLAAQTGGVTGVVVAKTTGDPLAYSIVGLDSLDRTAFTSDSGRFGIRLIAAGSHVIHVRRLGYTPLDVRVTIRDGVTETLRLELDRVAVSLGQIVVKAWPPCATPGVPADTSLVPIVQQIGLNAEQFRFLAEQYPFAYDVMIVRSARYRKDGKVVGSPAVGAKYTSKVARGYKPGEVIFRRGSNWYFQIPTLSEVADQRFLENHCWHYGGVSTIDDEEMYRVDVVASDSLKGVDVNGSFYVNRNTFQIRRSVLHLSRRTTHFPELVDMETTTDFFEVLPSISIPSHIYSVQVIDPEQRSFASEMLEEQRTTNFKFLGRRPGEAKP